MVADPRRMTYDAIRADLSQLGSRSIEDLVDLRLMNDPERRATLRCPDRIVTPALFTDQNLLSS